MKRFIKMLAVMFLVLGLLVGSAIALPQLGTSRDGTWFWQPGTPGVSRNGVSYQAIICEVYLTDAGRVTFKTNAYAVKVLYYIDCVGNRFASAAITYFDYNRNKFDEVVYDSFTWQDINPGTIAEGMKRICCGGGIAQ